MAAPSLDPRRRVLSLLPRRSDVAGARFGRDLVAGVVVGLVALPLALAFGASSGLGAAAGLTTAIVAGVLAAAFGGSRLQVSGPTGAMTVVLVPIVIHHGPQAVLVVGLMAGMILVALGYLGAGRFIRYVPVPVIEGFTIGIAAIIALQQVPVMLGVTGHGEKVLPVAVRAIADGWRDPHPAPLAMAVLAAVAIMVGARFRPGLPVSLVVVAVATVTAVLGDLDVAPVGHIPRGLPAPALPTVDLGSLADLVVPAVAVAALAALESLLSASVADGLTVDERHDPDRELVGQGIANLAVPFFGGVPATAAIARTAVNARAGASSRVAAMLHGVVLLLVVVALAPWVGDIPLAVLSGVLVAAAVQMVDVSSLRALLGSTRGDAAILVITAAATIALDLVTAVIVGMAVAGFVAVVRAARSATLDEQSVADLADHGEEERSLLDQHIVAYRLEGPLFFAAAHDFLLQLVAVSDVRVVILRMGRVTSIDVTGATVLADTIARLRRRGVTVLLSGVRPEHEKVLRSRPVYQRLLSRGHSFATTPEAIAYARGRVAEHDSA